MDHPPIRLVAFDMEGCLTDDPTVINNDAFGDGWMVRLEVADTAEFENLLPADEYEKLTE